MCQESQRRIFWKLRLYSVTLVLVEITMICTYAALSTRCLLLYML